VLADLVAVATGTAGPLPAGVAAAVVPQAEAAGRFYVRLSAETPAAGAIAAERLQQAGVGVASVHPAADGGAVAILTGATTYGAVAQAAADLASVPPLTGVSALLPVAD
jgi:hypothetical protein